MTLKKNRGMAFINAGEGLPFLGLNSEKEFILSIFSTSNDVFTA